LFLVFACLNLSFRLWLLLLSCVSNSSSTYSLRHLRPVAYPCSLGISGSCCCRAYQYSLVARTRSNVYRLVAYPYSLGVVSWHFSCYLGFSSFVRFFNLFWSFTLLCPGSRSGPSLPDTARLLYGNTMRWRSDNIRPSCEMLLAAGFWLSLQFVRPLAAGFWLSLQFVRPSSPNLREFLCHGVFRAPPIYIFFISNFSKA